MDHQKQSDSEHNANHPTADVSKQHTHDQRVHEQHVHNEMQMHAEHDGHAMDTDHSAHDMHGEHSLNHTATSAEDTHVEHKSSHVDHAAHVDHTGHEAMFRQRFWVCLLLSIPVLLYSPMIQEWLGFSMPAFPGSLWITPVFSVIVFIYGGVPFLQMARPEIKDRRPGMMTLISLAISVAFFYSLAALFLPTESSFFWELVTLIDIMLLGHWLEMRSVRQASGALNELAKLMPDTAERIRDDGSTVEVPISQLRNGNLVLVRPGASVPADGEVQEGESDVNEAMITGESMPVKKVPGDQVIAGTINGDGSLRVRVTATGDQTALAGIMRLVEQAQQSKSNTQILADKAAGWLVLHRPRRGSHHSHRLDNCGRVQRGSDRPGRHRAGDRLPARPGPGSPAGGGDYHLHGRPERHPGARPAGIGTGQGDKHGNFR